MMMMMMMMMMFPKDGSFGSPTLSQKLNMKSIVKNHTYHWLQRCPHKKHGKMISDRPTQEAITDREKTSPTPHTVVLRWWKELARWVTAQALFGGAL
jgi:hypothetical protein